MTALFLQKSWHNLLLIALCVFLMLLESHTGLSLIYDRNAIEAGQWWRIFSSQFVHLSWNHLWLNLACLAVMSIAFLPEEQPWHDCIFIFTVGLVVGLGTYLFNPEILYYKGLSGVLYGYVIYYLVQARKNSPVLANLILVAVLLKILWQHLPWYDDADIANLIGGSVAVNAHLYGAVCGLIGGMIRLRNQTHDFSTRST